MPHKHAAIKALRQTKKRTLANQKVKKTIHYLGKQVLKAVTAKDASKAQTVFRELQQRLDKAVKRKVFAKNTAARKKSRLSTRILKISK